MRRWFVLCPLLFAACATVPPAGAPTRPVAQPPAARPANALTPTTSAPPPIVEPSIRVGLLSDQSSVTFPRTADGYYVVTAEGPSTIRRGFTATAPLADATVRYAVQVSAISDLSSARSLATKVGSETGLRVDTVFDPASGTYKVLAGDFESSEAATPTRSNLTERGYGRDLMVVRRPSDQPFEPRVTLVDDEGDRHVLRGPSIRIHPITAPTIAIGGQPYRTSARLFVNARGLLNVTNDLNLEDYLLGVVPAEMGPSIYDEVEALKAQATAARTYAVRNRGQFESEGYDICPGPACQAYKGFAAEHELSTRAVRETAGLVIAWEGKPIDALYTSTCGGETSDVATMFPGRSEPYLKRARCVELDMTTLAGQADSSVLTEQQANARLFAALTSLRQTDSWSGRDASDAIRAAMRVAGFSPIPSASAASSRRGDVLDYLASVLHLDRNARVLTLPEDRDYFFGAAPDSRAYLAAAFLVKYGILPAQYLSASSLSQPMPRDELYALLMSWLREQNAVAQSEGKILALEGRTLTLKQQGVTTVHSLPPGIPILRRIADRFQELAAVPVLFGDRATVILSAKKPAAVIVQANYDGASFDRTSNFANWTRSRRADEIVPAMSRREPLTQLLDLRPVVVDASNRVAEMEVTAEGGRKFTLRGLPIRWSLEIPDNLFVFDKTRDPDGVDRYTFYGKGWGHGTGMCQVGAYGMAFRGWTFDRILRHFYSGVEIVPME